MDPDPEENDIRRYTISLDWRLCYIKFIKKTDMYPIRRYANIEDISSKKKMDPDSSENAVKQRNTML